MSYTNEKERKQRYISQKLCGHCGKNELLTKTLCKECADYHKQRHKRVRDEMKAAGLCIRCKTRPLHSKTMCQECLSQQKKGNDKRKDQYHEKGMCTKCGIRPLSTERQCTVCRSKENSRNKKVKDLVFNSYGGYVCACCGETEECFLSIDHINNDGAAHRKEVGSGTRFYWWVARNEFPAGLQVLCMNCQFGKKTYGICPHQRSLV